MVDANGFTVSGNPLSAPSGIATDAAGNVYITGMYSRNGFKITPSGVITLIIDRVGSQYGAAFGGASDIAIDSGGNVFVVSAHRVFRVSVGGAISVFFDDTTPDVYGNFLTDLEGVAADPSHAQTIATCG